MATVKGFIRSYKAAVRKSERERKSKHNKLQRERQRQAKEATKRYKEQLKRDKISEATNSVTVYNNYIRLIQSLHVACSNDIDWINIKNSPLPISPQKTSSNEDQARKNLADYKPSIKEKLFRNVDKNNALLNQAIQQGIEKDELIFQEMNQNYIDELKDWEKLQNLVEGLEKEEPDTYIEILNYFNPFSDIAELGIHIEFVIENNQVDVNIHIDNDSLIPNLEVKQTSTGKISSKQMTKSKYNELYQDHVCSLTIRVAREIFAHLPLKTVRVNTIGHILNTVSGHLEKLPILSVVMAKETITKLNLKSIDPSDSMQNFVHNMKFSKTKGFSPVEKIELS